MIVVGIPAKNEEENILNCLLSLDYQNVDIVVICVNNSTDKTVDKIKSFPQFIIQD